jgi:hypothetical protein
MTGGGTMGEWRRKRKLNGRGGNPMEKKGIMKEERIKLGTDTWVV